MNIGKRIKEIRTNLGLTADDVAEALGKDRSTIYRYESNEIEKLPTTVLEPLSKILKTTPACLMGWDANNNDISDSSSDTYHIPLNKESNLSSSDKNILNKYNKLNNSGQIKAESYIDGLLENPSYVKKEKNSTAHNSDDFVLDESILGTDYNLVANVGISEPPKVKKKGTHT